MNAAPISRGVDSPAYTARSPLASRRSAVIEPANSRTHDPPSPVLLFVWFVSPPPNFIAAHFIAAFRKEYPDMYVETTAAARPEPQPLPLPPRLLAAIAIDFAVTADFGVVEQPLPGERTFGRVHRSAMHDIWLIRWGAGSRTALHDHGGSAGALYVVDGELVEQRPNPAGVGRTLRRALHALEHRPMSATHVHEIANESTEPAASIHVYSPPLEVMHHYEPVGDSPFRVIRREVIDVGTLGADEQAADR